jgi:hypothetical protein
MSLEESLPADFEGRESILNKFSDVASLANSYNELQKNLGSSVRVPAPEASQEERSAFFQRLGAPETEDGYQTEEGMEEWSVKAKATAHKAHLTKDQWKVMASAQRDHMKNASAEWESGREASAQESRMRLGDAYDNVVERAKGALEALSSKEETLRESLGQIDLRDPNALTLFSMVGDMMSDGSTPVSGAVEPTDELGDDKELALRIRELMKEPAFSDRRAPTHERVQGEYKAKLLALMERGYQSVFDERLKNKPW